MSDRLANLTDREWKAIARAMRLARQHGVLTLEIGDVKLTLHPNTIAEHQARRREREAAIAAKAKKALEPEPAAAPEKDGRKNPQRREPRRMGGPPPAPVDPKPRMMIGGREVRENVMFASGDVDGEVSRRMMSPAILPRETD